MHSRSSPSELGAGGVPEMSRTLVAPSSKLVGVLDRGGVGGRGVGVVGRGVWVGGRGRGVWAGCRVGRGRA